MIGAMVGDLRRRWDCLVVEDVGNLQRYVAVKASVVTVLLIVLWALRGKDTIVVYMRF